jgi:hypothetical protein
LLCSLSSSFQPCGATPLWLSYTAPQNSLNLTLRSTIAQGERLYLFLLTVRLFLFQEKVSKFQVIREGKQKVLSSAMATGCRRGRHCHGVNNARFDIYALR